MRIGVANIVVPFLFLCCCATAEATTAVDVSKDKLPDGREVRRRLRHRAGHDKPPRGGPKGGAGEAVPKSGSTTTSRVIVRYANNDGRLDAMALAGGSKATVYHDFKQQSVVVLDLDDEAISLLDGHDENVMSVEADNLWEEQGFFEAYYNDLGRIRGRKLTESTPYGVRMVQADQVGMGSTPVAVCVADTGTSNSHPDLSAANIQGTDRVSSDGDLLHWSIDSRGHGTHVAGTIAAVPDNDVGVRGVGKLTTAFRWEKFRF